MLTLLIDFGADPLSRRPSDGLTLLLGLMREYWHLGSLRTLIDRMPVDEPYGRVLHEVNDFLLLQR